MDPGALSAALSSTAAVATGSHPLPSRPPATPPQQTTQPLQQGAFEPAATFTGPRAGAAFKSGPSGLGYYADKGEQSPSKDNNDDAGGMDMHALPSGDSESAGSSEQEEDQDAGVVSRRQRALMKQAFAGDDVVAEFAREKVCVDS